MSYPDRDAEHTQPIHGIPLLTKRDLMDATKEAVKELVKERVTEFGWWSLKTFGAVIAGALVVVALWANGYIKH